MHRGGNGIDKWYTFLEPGEIAIHDDRWLTPPWGILGGKPGMRSTKILVHTDGTRTVLPSKCDRIKVEPGDQLIFQTAGGGGWGDPLERDIEKVRGSLLHQKFFARLGEMFEIEDRVEDEDNEQPADPTSPSRSRILLPM